MTRMDRVFQELGQLYELNRHIRRSVWMDTGQPVQPRPEASPVKPDAESAGSGPKPPPAADLA